MVNKIIAFLLLSGISLSGLCETHTPAVRADHPNSYTVVKGDTLWDISGRFLEQPWLWPEIWEVNPQIDNPHLIYPGDVVYLRYQDGRPVLSVSRRGAAGGPRYVKLSPEIRSYDRDEAIAAIPIEAIRPFLSRPLVVTRNEMDDWPYVVSSYDQHLVAGTGNKIYIRDLPAEHQRRYSIYRRGPAYVIPTEDTPPYSVTTNMKYVDYQPEGEVLGYQALYVGDAVIQKSGDPASAIITTSEREILVGDRLLPHTEVDTTEDFIPTTPESSVEGQIVSVIDGVSEIGQYQVVVLTVGTDQGIDSGSVLGVYQVNKVVRDPIAAKLNTRHKTAGDTSTPHKTELVELPPEFAGVIMVFRAFEKLSYALVMDTDRPIHVYDQVSNL